MLDERSSPLLDAFDAARMVVVDMLVFDATDASFCLSRLICCRSNFRSSCSVISGVISMCLLSDFGAVVAVDDGPLFALPLNEDAVGGGVLIEFIELLFWANLSRLSIDELRL